MRRDAETRLCLAMVTRFQLIDRQGKTVANGEIDGDIYRVFSELFLGGYKEFKDTAEMFRVFEGCAIQPEMFPSAGAVFQPKLKM